MPNILVVEDEAAIRRVLVKILVEQDDKNEIEEAENGKIAIAKFKESDYDLVLCDIKMPGVDGIEVLDFMMKEKPETAVIMISGHGDLDTAVDCIKKGAFDYISKPPDLNRLLQTVKLGLERKDLVVENKTLKRKVAKRFQMVGSSKALDAITTMIDKVAPTEARVLITGPNGSGKELVAHQIHQKSERNKERLVEVNCAAIPSELIESELFGHKKGAFTSAIKDRQGKFESANGGTLFLDEIGDMSLSAQAKVLRALQENKITPVGGEREMKVNVRILAATNKDLKTEIAEGRFREDLFHRLSVIVIYVPPLNDRKEDIPELTDHFNHMIANDYGNAPKLFNADAIKELQKLDWSGNIREFRNVIERLIILCDREISAKDVKMFANK